jgi:hypothetical protein
MNASAEELQALVSREKIRACIARLARGEDRRDAATITASVWPEFFCDFGVFSGRFEDYLAWVVPGSPAMVVTQHFLGQSVIELRDEAALAETYVQSYHRVDTGKDNRDVMIGGRYLDRLSLRNGEWRIVHRTMLYDWTQDLGRAADWSQGLMGMQFTQPHYTGRAKDDFSAAFFAR